MVVTIGAICLAAGVAAFQILETLRAASLSVRAVLSYDQFSDGSFPFALAFKAWLQPIYPYGDVTLYVPPLATGLAIVAVVLSLRHHIRNPLIIFWLIVTITAFIMILGKYTPINYAFYNLPFISRFRIPSRHSFEWTFALSILGAFGWDAIALAIASRQQIESGLRDLYGIVLGILCLAASLVIGIFWWRFSSNPMNDTNLSYEIFHYPYLAWKAVFTLLIFVSAWQFLRMKICRWRITLLASVIMLACFFEPFIEHTRWHPGFEVPASRFSTFAPTTHFLRQYSPVHNRVYSDANPYEESLSEKPILDSVNLTALAGLHHVAGYEPLMLERYARALNNAPWETVPRDPSLAPNPTLFESKSHVLDLLNTTFAVVYPKSSDPSDPTVEKDGIRFSGTSLGIDVKSDQPISLSGEETIGDTLGLVTSLDNASHIPDNAFVAKLSIYTDDDRVIERHLRAGIDTADLAYEHANSTSIRHALARIFDSHPGNGNKWSAHSYLSRIDLGKRVRIERVEIIKAETAAGLKLFRASLYDSTSRQSTFFSIPSDSEKWQIAYQNAGVKILRNSQALPRAWLVTDALAVSKFEAWAAIRGRSSLPFDPRRTALLELDANKMPTLSGRPLSADSYARIVNYEPNRLLIETKADQPAVLVVSEMHYPGWVALLDGVKTSIHNTNFLLRGVVIPAGLHRVEMSYRAPGARKGAIISLFTLLLIGALAIYGKRKSANHLNAGSPQLDRATRDKIADELASDLEAKH